LSEKKLNEDKMNLMLNFFFSGASLKAALIQQYYHPPDLNILFTEIEPPDLNELFVKKKARFNKRTSSAIWNSPILKPGMS
jgi:inner centromere protein